MFHGFAGYTTEPFANRLISKSMRPKGSLESLVHIKGNRAYPTIGEGLVNPEDKLPLVQMRKRTAVSGTVLVNGTTG